MENEIKVNEFARLKNGRIVKVKDVKEDKIYFDSDIYFLDGIPIFEMENIFSDFIVKHSLNLIDLIEVGDMVHTRDVLNEDWYWMFDEEMVKATKETIEEGIDLVEIATKEMIESISYKVETH